MTAWLWMNDSAANSVCSPPHPNSGLPEFGTLDWPKSGKPDFGWGGVGGGGHYLRRGWCITAPPPPPPPPPQGGGGETEGGAGGLRRAKLTGPTKAVISAP